jgi:hypothetical protein
MWEYNFGFPINSAKTIPRKSGFMEFVSCENVPMITVVKMSL